MEWRLRWARRCSSVQARRSPSCCSARTSPWLLAGLLYLGSGIGLGLLRALQRTDSARRRTRRRAIRWLAGAILSGGVLGPVLLMWGLARMPASGAALLLNAEAVFTALHRLVRVPGKRRPAHRARHGTDRRRRGGLVLAGRGGARRRGSGARGHRRMPRLGIDNNLTRKVSLADARFVAMSEGPGGRRDQYRTRAPAGRERLPEPSVAALSARACSDFWATESAWCCSCGRCATSARRAPAPISRPRLSPVRCSACPAAASPSRPASPSPAVLMAAGVWLHLTEQHAHPHVHEPLEHESRA